jgi:hypothetical protein
VTQAEVVSKAVAATLDMSRRLLIIVPSPSWITGRLQP